ncbi:WhiB family transcriptional regulator [Mycolicibacterium chubuense]|uniref:WhiB family transcriptional regulator n=1 Tax=Mycolicibacterium chubuense TaxID=1800 RepID=UPI0013016C36
MTSPRPSRRITSITEPLPCHLDPDQWFSLAHRTAALAACLACRLRRSCAQLAPDCRPSWGMWAGIWIDGRFAAAAPLLCAVAAAPPAAPQHRRPSPPRPPSRPAASPPECRAAPPSGCGHGRWCSPAPRGTAKSWPLAATSLPTRSSPGPPAATTRMPPHCSLCAKNAQYPCRAWILR